MKRWWKVLKADKLVLIGVGIAILLAVVVAWPASALPFDPAKTSPVLRMQPPAVFGGSWTHALGTDQLGRDILSRVMAGARVSLGIAFAAVAISALLGVTLGLLCGYYGGHLDAFIMRLVDIQLAFPLLLLIIAIVAALGSSIPLLIVLLGLSGWAQYARIVRAETLRVRTFDYIEASRALGNSSAMTILRHVLPSMASAVTVFATFELARILLLESAVSFLGLGVQPPIPSWGTMIADGRNYLYNAWWVSTIPGICIVLTVLTFNFLGDGLRDALDPRSS